MHIMMIANDTSFAWNLRREILQAFIIAGHQVTLVAQILDFKKDFEEIGIKLIEVKTSRHGTNPIDDIKLYFIYKDILHREKPDVVFTNNIKPNVYAGLACQSKRITYIPNITGLGTPVENPGKLQKLTIKLYKIGIRKAKTVFFQNQDNIDFFYKNGMMPSNAKVVLLPGSGVNLETHQFLPWPRQAIHFLFAARIMKEKGIDLFLAAAHEYANEDIIFDICGQCDDFHYEEIMKKDKSIVYHGLQRDLTPFYAQCNCFLYPSYYPEGMSNVLLEAAACGRPVIAANRSGCRETVDDGVTGLLVPINNEVAVKEAVRIFLSMSDQKRIEMGTRGREKMEREFDRKIVVQKYMEEVAKVRA